jgi:hypothetical protein
MPRGAALIASAVLIALLATGEALAATVNPPSKDFGSQTQGTAGDPATFALMTGMTMCVPPGPPPCVVANPSNVDTSALGGGPGTTNTVGDFVIHNTDCQNPESSGIIPFVSATCLFDVRLMPTTTGPLSKTLSFTDSSGPTATLVLSGTGLPAPPAPVPTPTPTAHKKCKKKHHASAAKKCKKKR